MFTTSRASAAGAQLLRRRLALTAARTRRVDRFMASAPVEAAKDDESSVPATKFNWSSIVSPAFTLEQSAKVNGVIEEWTRKEHQFEFNPNDLPEIDWEHWEKTIKSPGVVAQFKAALESMDFANKGRFEFEAFSEAYKKALQKAGVDISGFQTKEQVDTATSREEKLAVEQGEFARSFVEHLTQDLEQITAEEKTMFLRTMEMDLAEFPEIAEALEEEHAGGLTEAISPLNEQLTTRAEIEEFARKSVEADAAKAAGNAA